MKESQGFMYLARRQCRKVSAMSWDDAGHEAEIAESVKRWIARGDTVERVERFKGDPLPEMICNVRPCDCDKARSAKR